MRTRDLAPDPAVYGYGREPTTPPERPAIKRGLFGATACSVSDAFALRDWEIGQLRQANRRLRQEHEAWRDVVQAELLELRQQLNERAAQTEQRLAALDAAAKRRDLLLHRELRRVRSAVLGEGITAEPTTPQPLAPGRSGPRPLRRALTPERVLRVDR